MFGGESQEDGNGGEVDSGVVMIVVNFKAYAEASGERAVELARICKKVGEETRIRIVAAVQVADLEKCVGTGVECWVQHVDPETPGKHTGYVVIEDVLAAGAKGTLLNHSEHKLDWEVLMATMKRIDFKLETCICAATVDEARRVCYLKPDYVAYEPPELIGSKDKSVSSEKPEVIKDVVHSAKCSVLVGAGVHKAEDVKVGLELGARGVLVASDVVLSKEPEKELRELVSAFKI